MLARCEKCAGIKTYLALGGMRKECDACHGVGSIIKDNVIDELHELHEPVQITNEPKRRGRKRKMRSD